MPSRRRKIYARTTESQTDINVTSLMDIMTTLLFFLLSTIVLMKISMLDVPIPKVVASATPENQKPPKPFKLVMSILPGGVLVESNALSGGKTTVPHLPEGDTNIKALHDVLVRIKKQFPGERSATILPLDSIPYQRIVDVIDASLELNDMDPQIGNQVRPKLSELGAQPPDPALYELFPDVVLGGVR